MAGRYDIFVSYSWEQKPLARNLKRALTKMAKKWYQFRARRVFLDSSSLSAGNVLESSVQDALKRSDNFLLIASPSAKASVWVSRELNEWLSTRGAERILIVLADGEIKWSDGSFDKHVCTALPEAALTCFDSEPIWVDMRDLDLSGERDRIPSTAASIVAGISGKDKDEIYDEDRRQQKTVKRISLAVAAVMTLLVAGLFIVSREALHQRDAARTNAAIANAHALAASSRTVLKTRLSTALVLAAAGNAAVDDVYTRSALLQALSYNPHLVRYFRAADYIRDVLWMGSKPSLLMWGVHVAQIADPATGHTTSLPVPEALSAAASAPDGELLALGLKDGGIRLWSMESRDFLWSLSIFDSQVASVEFDPAGGRLAAVSGSGQISVISLSTGEVMARASVDPSELAGKIWRITFASRSQVTVIGDRGQFLRVPLGESTKSSSWSPPLVPASGAGQLAVWGHVGGLGLSYPRGGVVHSEGVTGEPTPSTFHGISAKPGAFAMSPDGTLAATESNGVLIVAPALDPEHEQVLPTARLPAAANVGSRLAISSDETMVASGYGRTIGVWDLVGVAGIARSLPTDVRAPTKGTKPLSIVNDAATSTIVAIRRPVLGSGAAEPRAALTCWDTSTGKLRDTESIPGFDAVNAIAWNLDRTGLVAAMSGPTALREIPVVDGCPAGAGTNLAEFAGESQAIVDSLTPLPDSSLLILLRGGRLLQVDAHGGIVRSWGEPDKPSQRVTTYAVSSSGDELVIGTNNGGVSSHWLHGSDLPVRWTHPRAGGEVVSIAFASDRTVAVSRNTGNVFLFDRSTGVQQRILGSAQAYILSTAASGSLLLGTQPGYRLAVWDTASWRLLTSFVFAYPGPGTIGVASSGAESQRRTSMVATPSGSVWVAAPGVSITSWNLRATYWVKAACEAVGTAVSDAAATDPEYGPPATPGWCAAR